MMGSPARLPAGSVREVFAVFLGLGLTSFGGPIAHLGYYRRQLVERRGWLDDDQYAQVVALAQFLPGPASSQVGFSLGLMRAGWAGALAAFVAFTLPSAVVMFAFAAVLPVLSGPLAGAALNGLKLVALAVVAHGVVGMAMRLCPDPQRVAIAVAVTVAVLLAASVPLQLLAIALAALAGLILCRHLAPVAATDLPLPHGPRTGVVLIGVFAAALYDPLWVTAVHGVADLVIALAGFGLLLSGRVPVLVVVAGCVSASTGWVAVG